VKLNIRIFFILIILIVAAPNYGNADSVTDKRMQLIASLREAAEHGDIKAEIELGRRYNACAGVPLDKQEGMRWFRKAPAQGDLDGLLWIVNAERTNWNEDKEAHTWEKDIYPSLKAKAEQGDAESQYKFGVLIKRNPDNPGQFGTGYLEWWKKSAEQRNIDAEKLKNPDLKAHG